MEVVGCPNCRRENPIGALWCNNCGTSLVGSPETDRQPVTQSPSPHEYKEPPPPPPDSESEVMQAKPLIGVTLVQSPYPQEKQPIESILPTDVACPYCENKMVYLNRYSSYYCKKCKTYPWRCKSCKHSMSSSLNRCQKCGAARTGVNSAGVKYCPNCRKENSQEAVFCSNCAMRLPPEPSQPVYLAPPPVQQQQPIYQQQPYQMPAQYQQPIQSQYQQPITTQSPAYGYTEGGNYPPPSLQPQKAGRKARWKIAAVATVALLIISSIGIYYYLQNTITNNGTPTEVSPFQILNLGDRGFSENDSVKVRFYNSNGYSVNVTALSPNPVEVAVPLYVNPETGSFDTASVSIKIIGNGTSIDIDKTVRILAPLTTNESPGALTTAFIDASLSSLGIATTYLNSVSNKPGLESVVSPDIRSMIYNYTIQLGVINNCTKDISSNTTGDVELGTINTQQGNVQLKIDNEFLSICDGIVKSFIDQVEKIETATNNGEATISSSKAVIEEIDDPANAREWLLSVFDKIGTDIEGSMGTVSKCLGVAAGVLALAAAVASSPVLLGVAAAVGTMSVLMTFTSSVLPAIYGTALAAGSQMFLDAGPDKTNPGQVLEKLVVNTVANGVSFGASAAIGSTSEVGSAVFDITDSIGMFSASLTNYVKDGIKYAAAFDPNNPDSVSLDGTWSGTYTFAFVGVGGWTYTEAGTLTMTVTVSGTTFSGSAYIDGIMIRNYDTGEITGYSSSSGDVTGTIQGISISGTFSFPFEGGGTATESFDTILSGNTIQGTLTGTGSGSFSITKA